MTNMQTDFSAHDREMARRAHQLLHDPDQPGDPYTTFVVALQPLPQEAQPDRAAIAQFGLVRWLDAQRSNPARPPLSEPGSRSAQILTAQFDATEGEKGTHDRPRRFLPALRKAVADYAQSYSLREQERALQQQALARPIAPQQPTPAEIQAALLCFERLQAALQRQNQYPLHGPFPSLWGLCAQERKAALRRQAHALVNRGIPHEEVADLLLLGCQTDSAQQKRNRVRHFVKYKGGRAEK